MEEYRKRLLSDFQRDFPLTPTPYADIAQGLGVEEEDVIQAYKELKDAGTISRIGAVVRPNRMGASTLAALAVPPKRLEEVAELVNGYHEVNHNYEREHRFNLWFVLTAPDYDRVEAVLDEITHLTGLPSLYLPMVQDYHLDLGI